jgi:uncharacterized membrane protein (UPF0127 family)
MKVKIIILVLVALVFLAFISYPWGRDKLTGPAPQIFPEQNSNQTKIAKNLKIGEIILNVEVVDTEAARTLGLSGKIARENDPLGLGLGGNEGMLFVFEREGNYGFWMKDMNFPIDIIWIDKDKKITHTENNVSPETYLKKPPQIFGFDVTSLYVLEIPSGFLVENNVKIGDFVAF